MADWSGWLVWLAYHLSWTPQAHGSLFQQLDGLPRRFPHGARAAPQAKAKHHKNQPTRRRWLIQQWKIHQQQPAEADMRTEYGAESLSESQLKPSNAKASDCAKL